MFLLEGLGFDQQQIQSFKLTGDLVTQYYGFVNQTPLEAVITSKSDFDPAAAGRYFMQKKKAISDLFKLKGSDHTRVCTIGIASEFLESPYQKKIVLPQAFFSSSPDAKQKAMYANSLFLDSSTIWKWDSTLGEKPSPASCRINLSTFDPGSEKQRTCTTTSPYTFR